MAKRRELKINWDGEQKAITAMVDAKPPTVRNPFQRPYVDKMQTHRALSPPASFDAAPPAMNSESGRPRHAPRANRALPMGIADAQTLGPADWALMLGISTRTFKRWRQSGRIPPPDLKIGQTHRWTVKTVRAWFAVQAKRAHR